MSTPQNSTFLRSFLSGFNLNSLFLLIVIILLAAVVLNPSPLRTSDYYYRATHVTCDELSLALKKRNEELSREKGRMVNRTSVEWPTSYMLPDDSEYVGFLCPDGGDGAWILIRWPKN